MIKRCFDYFLTIFGIIVSSPFLLLVTLLVRTKIGSPILFTQNRPGLNGQIFKLYKFRTMTEAKDSFGNLLPDADRIVPFGRFLRRASLDELPSLLNVLKGEMSLVGPRPLFIEYLDNYSPEQARRHEVKPGITGWAQVNGRNAISWEEKFKLDVWYVDNQSLWLDIKVLWMTFIKVFKREDVIPEGNSTIPFFYGSDKDEE